MRKLVLALAAIAGCRDPAEPERLGQLEFPHFTIATPSGWTEVTEPRILAGLPAGSHALKRAVRPKGWAPSIFIQEITPARHALLRAATVDVCRDQLASQLVGTANTVDEVRVAALGPFHGCDIISHEPAGKQGTRYLVVSDGTIEVSLVCSRDKAGDPEVDALCETIARSITPRS